MASRTMKQALFASSGVQGGRKRRGKGVRVYLFPLTCSTVSIACLNSSILTSGSFGER